MGAVVDLTARQEARRDRAQGFLRSVAGLNMRERAAVRLDHAGDYHWNASERRWYVACLCGAGASSPNAGDIHDWHDEHIQGAMLVAAREKRAADQIDLALADAHDLTRERFGRAL